MTGKTDLAEIVLYSDGGGEKASSAAAACIIDNPKSGERLRLVVFLGGATNNEAEIIGGLLGFSFLQLLAEQSNLKISLRWVCDSEYVLKSATGYINGWQKNGWKTADKKPVKNQGLWRSYLQLSAGIRVTPQHVRGHTGHEENEACDQACTWARMNGAELAGRQAVPVELLINGDDENWFAFDGQEFLAALRNIEGTEPPTKDLFGLFSILQESGISDFTAASQATSKRAPAPVHDDFAAVLAKLKDALSAATINGKTDKRGAELAASLKRLLKKYTAV